MIDLALRGAIVGNASTELGSTPAGAFTWQTQLTADGDGFRLNGKKFFTTGTLYADYAEVLASDPDGATVIALVPTDRAGRHRARRLGRHGPARHRHRHRDLRERRGGGRGDAAVRTARTPRRASPRCICRAPSSSCTSPHSRPACCTRCGRTRWHTSTSGRAASRGRRARLPATIRCCNARSARSPVPHTRPRRPCWPRPTRSRLPTARTSTATDPNLELAHEASLQAASAKVVVDALAQKAASQMFDVGGASVVRQAHLLDRHWRNIRTLASHNPTSYKAQAIGAYYVRGTTASRQRILLSHDHTRTSSHRHHLRAGPTGVPARAGRRPARRRSPCW